MGVYADNADGGTLIPNASKLSPGGLQGPTGDFSTIAVGGDLMGNLPDPLLVDTGTPGAYGSSISVPVITTDAKGRVVSAVDTPIAFPGGGSPGGVAGGSLSGFYPNPSIAASGVVAGSYGTGTAWPIITVAADGRLTAVTLVTPLFLSRSGLLGSLIGAVFNTTADQPIVLNSSRCRITSIIVEKPNMDFSTIAPSGGLYTGPAKTGNVLVAAGQTYNTLVTSVDWKALTLAAYPLAAMVVSTTIYFSLSVSIGAPPIPAANIWVFGETYA